MDVAKVDSAEYEGYLSLGVFIRIRGMNCVTLYVKTEEHANGSFRRLGWIDLPYEFSQLPDGIVFL